MRAQGYTLVELLVVLAIMALLAVMAVPLLSGPTERLRVEAAARVLADRLRSARSLALARGRAQQVVIGRSSAQRNIAFTFRGPLRNEIDFYPDGSSSGGTVIVSGSGVQRRVSVGWPSGRIAVDE